ncbi:MAG TPA: hypothetical protein VHT05_08965 [Candidatus Elarobacter sp.]|jgi:virginiamycin B lyase|nr:hypothetical protein [Candidatus Elarobacter sp.]
MPLRQWFPGFVLAALAVAGCGGGGSTTAPPFFTGTAAPTLPASTTASVTVGAAPASATFAPIAGGLSLTIAFPATTGGSATLSMTLQTSSSPAPALQSSLRRPKAIGASGITGYAYVTVSSSATVGTPSTPTLTFTQTGTSQIPAGTQGYVAFYNPATGQWTTIVGPVTIGGTLTTWTMPSAPLGITFEANTPYEFALFSASGAVATPTPTPTPTSAATPTPSPTPSAVPSPTITEFPAVSTGPNYGVLCCIVSTNGALWFGAISASGTTDVGRMTTQGVVTNTYALPNAEGTISLAVGPQSNVVFSAVNGALVNDVGLVTGGSVTSYALAGSSCDTGLIATGSDGNLWTCGDTTFESNPAKIDRVTPQGSVTTFSVAVPSSGAVLQGMTPGPDGALWYVGIAGSSTPIVGRITTAGVSTDYSAAAASAGVQHPYAITAGPDGALWFTDSNLGVTSNGHNAIGRITTSGAITEYPLSPSSSPFGITTGPDGALWFTDGAQNAIGRITTSGAIKEYGAGITSGSYPNGITTGPDAALWFTEANSGKIGRLSFGTSGSAVRRSPPR